MYRWRVVMLEDVNSPVNERLTSITIESESNDPGQVMVEAGQILDVNPEWFAYATLL